jgi:hypothetical protein
MSKKSILALTSFSLFIILACNATFNVGYPTATVVPPTVIPSNTSVPISGQVTLVSQPYTETNQDPAFTITAQIPQLSGSDDPRVGTFNQLLNDVVQKEIVVFRGEFTRGPIMEVSTNSFLDVTYELLAQYNDIWSFKFYYSFYTNGAAHPGDFSHTVNYDLGAGRELTLGDLFLPGSNHLEAISNYCITELSKQPFFDGSFTTGADPTPDHYRNWNITPNGLMITFDTYQVAPGAAGPQIITIPFGQLNALIDLQGPLAGIFQ